MTLGPARRLVSGDIAGNGASSSLGGGLGDGFRSLSAAGLDPGIDVLRRGR